jgi:hypothetical protein
MKCVRISVIAGAAVLVVLFANEFRQHQIRAKVKECGRRFKVFGNACMAYADANGRLPASVGGHLPRDVLGFVESGGNRRRETSATLLMDPFAADGSVFRYYAETTGLLSICSRGPDHKWDLDWESKMSQGTVDFEEVRRLRYDPTNGLQSGGDLIWVGAFSPDRL